jgi:hypothetical protein
MMRYHTLCAGSAGAATLIPFWEDGVPGAGAEALACGMSTEAFAAQDHRFLWVGGAA